MAVPILSPCQNHVPSVWPRAVQSSASQHLTLENGSVHPIPVEQVEVAHWLHAKDSWLCSPVQPLTSGI